MFWSHCCVFQTPPHFSWLQYNKPTAHYYRKGMGCGCSGGELGKAQVHLTLDINVFSDEISNSLFNIEKNG